MKELSQYKEEIFRRSEQKKRQIKKRCQAALGVGIPLCLCAVLTVTVLPNLPLGKKAFAPSTEAVYDAAENAMPEMSVEGFRVTDSADVAKVMAILEATKLEDTGNKQICDQEDFLADQGIPGMYRLSLGSSEYRIRGQQIDCETTGETLWLSVEQASSLYTLLLEVADCE